MFLGLVAYKLVAHTKKTCICIYKEQKRQRIEESQHCVSSFFSNKPTERMNEEICYNTKKEKRENGYK